MEERLTSEVVEKLLSEMNRVVMDYHRDVKRTPQKLSHLINGTAFFPGGTGLWRGKEPGGDLPLLFPEGSVMFIGHNFGNQKSLDLALFERGEVSSAFKTLWSNLVAFLEHAGPLDPGRCFFTNALMGLRLNGRSGDMPACFGSRESFN